MCGEDRLIHSDLDLVLKYKMRGGHGSFKKGSGWKFLLDFIGGDDNGERVRLE